MKKYNTYIEFKKDNIGKRYLFQIGSSTTSINGGNTPEFIDEQFNELIKHHFIDFEYVYNYADDDDKVEYLKIFNTFLNDLINTNLFGEIWDKFFVESGNYNANFTIKKSQYSYLFDEYKHLFPYSLLNDYQKYLNYV